MKFLSIIFQENFRVLPNVVFFSLRTILFSPIDSYRSVDIISLFFFSICNFPSFAASYEKPDIEQEIIYYFSDKRNEFIV